MAPGKRNPAADGNSEAENGLPAAEKIARLLALIVTKDMESEDAALKLDSVGFSAREISNLLGVGPNYVNVAKHRKKAGGAKKARKQKAD
ncbi:MAG: hypothetical protein WCE45_05780 [Sedimentisphaerales bacterium]